MKVRDLMTADVITLDARSPLVSAEEVMGLRRVRHLPCVADGKFVGLITHRDLLRAYIPTGDAVQRAIYSSKTRVSEYMHTDVDTIHPDLEVTKAAQLMRRHKYGCLPVVDDGGVLVGIVTDADFLFLAEVVVETLAELQPDLLEKVKTRLDTEERL